MKPNHERNERVRMFALCSPFSCSDFQTRLPCAQGHGWGYDLALVCRYGYNTGDCVNRIGAILMLVIALIANGFALIHTDEPQIKPS